MASHAEAGVAAWICRKFSMPSVWAFLWLLFIGSVLGWLLVRMFVYKARPGWLRVIVPFALSAACAVFRKPLLEAPVHVGDNEEALQRVLESAREVAVYNSRWDSLAWIFFGIAAVELGFKMGWFAFLTSASRGGGAGDMVAP